MRNILIIGAGRSASSLIKYLLDKSSEENLHIIVADVNLDSAKSKINQHKNATAIALDIFKEEERKSAIKKADIVVSMLPARMHLEVAKDCLLFGKSMVTASYVSKEMQELDTGAKEKGLTF